MPTANELVQKGLQQVAEAKKRVELKKPEWKTSCVIDLFGKEINIQVCTDMFTLVRARSIFKDALKQMKELKLVMSFETTYRNCEITSWINDIEQRIQYLVNANHLSKLSQVESKLGSLMTEDQKRESELNKLLESFPDLFK